MFAKTKIDKIFEVFFLILLLSLVIGIPLIFSPYTRSVFEINKLLLLRVVTILALVVWAFKYILYQANGSTEEPTYKLFNLKWQKVGLEIPVLIWLFLCLLSTFFSVNWRISLIGSYDRWEGLFTVINYSLVIYLFAKLITKKYQFFWVLGGLIFGAVISAFYGFWQSFGLDFMAWSVDPTQRVFACINNPVHFCPYLAMLVPICLGLILFIVKSNFKYQAFIKIVLLLSFLLIYYIQVLSYSRAAWMGFIGAMTLFYFFALDEFNIEAKKKFIFDFFFTIITLSVFYLTAIFNYQEKGLLYAGLIWGVVIFYIFYNYLVFKMPKRNIKEQIKFLGVLVLMYFLFIFDLAKLNFSSSLMLFFYYLGLGLLFLLVLFYLRRNDHTKLLDRLIIVLIFVKLQFIALNYINLFLYLILIIAYAILKFKDSHEQEVKKWLILFLFCFGFLLLMPSLPNKIADLFNPQAQGLKAAVNVEEKIASYQEVAIKGTARTSMWKSAMPWIKDYWLLGSGPDTVKYLYPTYRLPDYGILEGGHNYTPDRLHNEYLNTLATRGILGFLVFYFGIVLGWYLIMLKTASDFLNKPINFLVFACIAGVTIYLGQIMFNFGVVATLFLFYTLMGLGLVVRKL